LADHWNNTESGLGSCESDSDLWSVINEGLAKVVRLQNVRYFCGGEPGSRQDFAVDTTDTLSRLTPVSITRNNRGIIANTKRPNRLIIQL
jgi:hypothetical protein